MKRLHLIDGTYELFRAHFSKRPSHQSAKGQDVKAAVGLVSSFLTLLETQSEAVTHLAAAFDNPIRSFRNDLFDGYKTEEGVAEELLAQFDLVEDGVRALGVTVWSMDKYEADDAMATGAAIYAGSVDQVRIMTPDKDLGQCVRGKKVVQVDRRQEKEMDEDALRVLRGIGPKSIPDFLGLVGDTADGIPGLDGFGEKGAAAVLAVHPHLEDIPKSAAAWKAKPRGYEKLAVTLAENFEDALLYRKLATVVEDVPLKESFAQLEYTGTPRDAFTEWCKKMDAPRLLERPVKWR